LGGDEHRSHLGEAPGGLDAGTSSRAADTGGRISGTKWQALRRLACVASQLMQPLVYFEIPADSPEKIIEFYTSAFGWRFDAWSGVEGMDYWVINTCEQGNPGINGGLLRREHEGQPMVNTIQVPNLDEYIGKVESAGGTIVVPRMDIPQVGSICYFKDVEGNILGMWEPLAASNG
jgi:uncharacterized protein